MLRITGVWTLSNFLYVKELKDTMFYKLDLFPLSGEGGRTPTFLGSLERANLNPWTTHVRITVAI
jgi:hypothetical protein